MQPIRYFLKNMKVFNLPTRKRPLIITVPLISDEEVEVFIVGYDPASPNTEYFSRRIEFSGNDQVNFQCPQTPRRLKIMAWSKGTGKFEISKISVSPLIIQDLFTEDEKKDIEFIESFSRRCGRLPARRFYYHKGASFRIQYLPVIRTDTGKEHATPARIHTELPLMQVSKKHFIKMTIPQRVAILTHEYSHNYINMDQDSEFEADSNMVDLYEDLGYGKLEAVYAFANVMSDTDVNYSRLNNIINQL